MDSYHIEGKGDSMINLFEVIEDQSKFSQEQMEILERIEKSTVDLCESIIGAEFSYYSDLMNEISEMVRDKLLENGYVTHYPAIYYKEDGTPYMEEYQNPKKGGVL